MSPLSEWFLVRFDAEAIYLEVDPPGGTAWAETLPWARIIRVCFKAGDWFEPDEIYIFSADRAESYLIPTEAGGGQALWGEIIDRGLFAAELAIQAATATNEIFCWPAGDEEE